MLERELFGNFVNILVFSLRLALFILIIIIIKKLLYTSEILVPASNRKFSSVGALEKRRRLKSTLGHISASSEHKLVKLLYTR